MELITSVRNPKVASWKSLRERKGRDMLDAFLVEGEKMVREALASGFELQALLIRENYECPFQLPDHIPSFILSGSAFSAVSETRSPQGIAAVLRRKVLPLSGNRFVALDAVQDPGNVGTIIRTADAAGFDGVLLGHSCADLFSPKVLRSTMGSIFRMRFSFPDSLADDLLKFRDQGYSVISSQLEGDSFYERKNISPSFVLVIGNEGNGISGPVREVATHRLRLPMRGGAESLNAAVAAGIMMYDLMK